MFARGTTLIIPFCCKWCLGAHCYKGISLKSKQVPLNTNTSTCNSVKISKCKAEEAAILSSIAYDDNAAMRNFSLLNVKF